MQEGDGTRARELAAAWRTLDARLRRAAVAAGRDDVPAVVAVTKTWPAGDAAALVRAGATDLGEARDAEAREKVAALRDAGVADVRWHAVGQVQSRAARSVGRWADVVHSVDRPRLVRALSRAAQEAGRAVSAYVQVDLGEGADPARGGALGEAVLPLCDEVAGAPGLHLVGLMAVAPRGEDPRPAFDRLAALSARVVGQHPGATGRSAGMSDDLEAAVAAGATVVRVGSALLGRRGPGT